MSQPRAASCGVGVRIAPGATIMRGKSPRWRKTHGAVLLRHADESILVWCIAAAKGRVASLAPGVRVLAWPTCVRQEGVQNLKGGFSIFRVCHDHAVSLSSPHRAVPTGRVLRTTDQLHGRACIFLPRDSDERPGCCAHVCVVGDLRHWHVVQ